MGKEIKLNVKPEDLQTITCTECGSIYFRQVIVINKISKFITGDRKDQLMPVPTFRCDDCGHVPEEFRPVKPTNN